MLDQVRSIIRNQFDDPSIVIRDDTAVDAIPDWDSIAQVQIIVAIENHFHITFDTDQFLGFENMGELIDCTLELVRSRAPLTSDGPPDEI